MFKYKKALFILQDDFTNDALTFKKAVEFTSKNKITLDCIFVLPDLKPLLFGNTAHLKSGGW